MNTTKTVNGSFAMVSFRCDLPGWYMERIGHKAKPIVFPIGIIKVPWETTKADISSWDYFSHNPLTDSAKEVFKPSKDAESLPVFDKNWKVWIWVFCGLRRNRGRIMSFCFTWSDPERQPQEVALCVFFVKDTRRKFASTEPLNVFLVLVVSTLWTKNNKINNQPLGKEKLFNC